MTNMLMMDYAKDDLRSVSAMLRSKGDKRERLWARFEQEHPEITDLEELQRAFLFEIKHRNDSTFKTKSPKLARILMVLGLLFVLT